MSVNPCARIEKRIVNAAILNIRGASSAGDFSTISANSIEATPFGPNQAMNPRSDRSKSVPTSEISIATGRATSSARRMNAISAGIDAS